MACGALPSSGGSRPGSRIDEPSRDQAGDWSPEGINFAWHGERRLAHAVKPVDADRGVSGAAVRGVHDRDARGVGRP